MFLRNVQPIIETASDSVYMLQDAKAMLDYVSASYFVILVLSLIIFSFVMSSICVQVNPRSQRIWHGIYRQPRSVCVVTYSLAFQSSLHCFRA